MKTPNTNTAGKRAAAIEDIPRCDEGPECPLGPNGCPTCSPIEELVGGLRVVTEVPERCPDCKVHFLLHHATPKISYELRLIKAREALRMVEAELGIKPYTARIAADSADEDRAC